jgi:hypothetical protein
MKGAGILPTEASVGAQLQGQTNASGHILADDETSIHRTIAAVSG